MSSPGTSSRRPLPKLIGSNTPGIMHGFLQMAPWSEIAMDVGRRVERFVVVDGEGEMLCISIWLKSCFP